MLIESSLLVYYGSYICLMLLNHLRPTCACTTHTPPPPAPPY